jgi:hypothetical protein
MAYNDLHNNESGKEGYGMKRLIAWMLALVLGVLLCACGLNAAEQTEPSVAPTQEAPATETPAPTPEPTPQALVLAEPVEGWADSYLAFIDDNYDIFAALWPEGLTGVGFIDLDLDGTPEMVVFDLGASATLGVQLFDLIDGQVYCVSSVLDSAAGAFGDEYFSKISVCTSYFEAFRLCRTEDGYCFWVSSANGTLESTWDEVIRFDCVDGVLTPVSVCGRYLASDVDTGQVVTEQYTVGAEETDEAAYNEAAAVYTQAEDLGYEAKGVFLWNDMSLYDTTYDGLMAMARAAAEQYVPISEDVLG